MAMTMMAHSAESRSLFGGRTAAAALFGNKNNGDDKDSKPTTSSELPIPPPPPPGRPPLPTAVLPISEQTTTMPPPPPPPQLDGGKLKEDIRVGKSSSIQDLKVTESESDIKITANPQDPASGQSQNKNEAWSQQQPQQQQQHQWEGNTWGNDPQYGQQQQRPQQPYYAGDDQYNHQQQNQWPSLEQQLDDSINRENNLVDQIQNMTGSIGSMQQQEQLHARQMDVLTERIMQAEAEIAVERNHAMEYQSNCTDMARQVALLHDELLDWQSRCADFADQHKNSDGRMKELKKDLKEARAEAENLAISIENSRIRDHMDESRRKGKKSRGLLGWLFSFLVSSTPEVDEDMDSPQDLAKSTLLKALQIERNNVDELDAFVVSLQQNNSAIAEMVNSRDLIIDELNERVAVFEEDKIVLKAALKQLQKEMKEEAPRSQKMIDDLEVASQEVSRLSAEIEDIIDMHQSEISSLLQSITQKQTAINASETKHSEIGRYVDMLEERLANFSITRRDLEVREKACKEAEAYAGQMEEERDNLRVKIEEFETERNDFKSLFEELGQELASLRQENARLAQEKDGLESGAQRSREALASLENNMKRLDQETEKWKSKTIELETELNATQIANTEIQSDVQKSKTENEHVKKQLEGIRVLNRELLEQIETKTFEASTAQNQAESKSSELAEKEETLERTIEELKKNEAKVKEVSEKLLELEVALERRNAEVAKSKLQDKAKDPPPGPQVQGIPTSYKQESPSQTHVSSTKTQSDPTLSENTTSMPPPGRGPIVKEKRPLLSRPAEAQQASKKQKKPLRTVRKLFSKVTGVHNAFTRPSEKGALKGPPPHRPAPNGNQKLPARDTKNAPRTQQQQQRRPSPGNPDNQRAPPIGVMKGSSQQEAPQVSPPAFAGKSSPPLPNPRK